MAMMNRCLLIALFLFLAEAAGAGERPVFVRQVIEIADMAPLKVWQPVLWKDLDYDGRVDLITVTTSGSLLLYRQAQTGFASRPTQIWALPRNTAWVDTMDVLKDPGQEIVYSAPDGIGCYRQTKMGYEREPVPLIRAIQVNGRVGMPLLRGRSWQSEGEVSTRSLTTVFADHCDEYQVDKSYRLSFVRRVALESSHFQTIWSSGRDSQESGSFALSEAWHKKHKDERASGKANEEEQVRERLLKVLDRGRTWSSGVEKEDVDGDGSKDWIVWFMPREMDMRTVFQIYLRQKDGKVPEKPSQVLRYRGGPPHPSYFELGMSSRSPFIDVNRDGTPDIVLVEIRNKAISVSSFLEMAMKNGVDLTCAVILGRKGRGFPARPDFRLDFTAALPWNRGMSSILTLEGDFNGDGRPDLMVRRNATQLDVYPSSRTGELFERRAAFIFDVPADSFPVVEDYNGDGISDVCLQKPQKKEIVLYLSQKRD